MFFLAATFLEAKEQSVAYNWLLVPEHRTFRRIRLKMQNFTFLFFAICALSLVDATHASNPLNGIRHMLRRHDENSYSEAYVTMIAPNKFSVDHNGLLRGLTSAKNCIGRLATFDCNEYAHIDNPMQLGGSLGFVAPPLVPFATSQSKLPAKRS